MRLVAASGLMSSFVAEVVAGFYEAHPLLDLKIDTLPSEDILRQVATGEADLGLSFDLPRDPELITLASMHQPLGVVVPPDHPMAGRPALRLSDCVGERLILPPKGSGIRVLLDVACAETRFEPKIAVESNSVELRKALVRKGVGITILAAVDLNGDLSDGVLSHIPARRSACAGADIEARQPIQGHAGAAAGQARRGIPEGFCRARTRLRKLF